MRCSVTTTKTKMITNDYGIMSKTNPDGTPFFTVIVLRSGMPYIVENFKSYVLAEQHIAKKELGKMMDSILGLS